MKKVIMAVAAVFGFVIQSGAQQKGDVELGANLGFNYATVQKGSEETKEHYGMNAGVSVDYYFSDQWSIKTKLTYDQKGWNRGSIYLIDTPYITYGTNYDLDYLTVPVTASWHFGKKRNWYLDLGPYVGFLLSAKDSRFKRDVKEYFNQTDWGLALGVGLKIPVTDKLKLFVECDSQSGFSDLAQKKEDKSYRNSRVALNVGMNFTIK